MRDCGACSDLAALKVSVQNTERAVEKIEKRTDIIYDRLNDKISTLTWNIIKISSVVSGFSIAFSHFATKLME